MNCKGIKIGGIWLTWKWEERKNLNWYAMRGLLIEGPGFGNEGRVLFALRSQLIGPA